MTALLLSARRGAGGVLRALFADYLWPSLRRRVALALSAVAQPWPGARP